MTGAELAARPGQVFVATGLLRQRSFHATDAARLELLQTIRDLPGSDGFKPHQYMGQYMVIFLGGQVGSSSIIIPYDLDLFGPRCIWSYYIYIYIY